MVAIWRVVGSSAVVCDDYLGVFTAMTSIATMLQDVLTSLVQPPATERYPFEGRHAPARLRGELTWEPAKCTGCQLCVKDCPSGAIKLDIVDRKEKRFVMHYQVDQCLFCSQCVTSCPRDALAMLNDRWELATTSKDQFKLYYGSEADVQSILANCSGSDAQAK
jgi:formate hydrogenlyase subunit 6/NADH:ubiquinone oxidoreductase subunit I